MRHKDHRLRLQVRKGSTNRDMAMLLLIPVEIGKWKLSWLCMVQAVLTLGDILIGVTILTTYLVGANDR
jgi:hypothetical protein